MVARKRNPVPTLRVKESDTLRQVYAKARRALTAADLQKYTEIEDGIPARDILADLKALDKQDARKRRKKPNARRR